MKHLFLQLLCLWCPIGLFGQSLPDNKVSVSGQVNDSQEQALAGAHVQFVLRADTLQRQGTATGADGSFSVQLLPGTYDMQVSYIGYTTYSEAVEVTGQLELRPIRLKEDRRLMKELTVTGRNITYDAEGYRMNVENHPLLKEMDLDRILNFLPGLINRQGSMTVYGKPVVTVYLNRRKLRLSGQDLLDYLQSYNGEMVKEIQVITSQGAEESASGAGRGMLKIRTTKVNDGGMFSARARTEYKEDGHSIYVPGLMVQSRNGKWSTYGNANFNGRNSDERREGTDSYLESGTERQTAERSDQDIKNIYFTAGVGYDFSPDDILTVEGQYDKNRSDLDARSHVLTQQHGETLSENSTLTESPGKDHRRQLSADFTHAWKSVELYFSGIYIHNNSTRDRRHERAEDANAWSNRSYNRSRRTLAEGKIDLQQQIGIGKLKAGAFYSGWDNDDYTANRLLMDGVESTLGTYTDLYRYREEVWAAYASYDFNIKKISVSAGLRYEYKDVRPQSDLTPERNHTYSKGKLYPNLRITYRLNPMKGHNLSLNYARNIESPGMSMLNPGIKWNNEYSYSMGNPYMEPVCNNTYGGMLTLFSFYSIGYDYSASPIFSGITNKEADSDIVYTTYENGGKKKYHIITGNFMQMLGTRWMVNATIAYLIFNEEYRERDIKGTSWNLSFQTTGQLPKGFDLAVNGLYVPPSKNVNGSVGRYIRTGATLSKSFLRNSLTASLSYTYQPDFKININIEGMQQHYHSNSSPHTINVSLRYVLKWGNMRAKVRNSRAKSEESGRLRN